MEHTQTHRHTHNGATDGCGIKLQVAYSSVQMFDFHLAAVSEGATKGNQGKREGGSG